MPQGGLTEAQVAEARELALEVLIRFRDGDRACRAAAVRTRRCCRSWSSRWEAAPTWRSYLPLLEEELAVRGEDRRAPAWRKDEIAPDTDFEVLDHRCGHVGSARRAPPRARPASRSSSSRRTTTSAAPGSRTRYPGCRVDNPNHNYSYSFAQRHDWPLHFSTQDVLLDYFRRCAEAFDLRRFIRFGTHVESATWSEPERRWAVEIRSADGHEHTLARATRSISAVGQLNRPLFPDIDGRDSFEGPSFHSARWDHDLDLDGKRVAVIGTGASAVQFIPEIAPRAGELLVFQRTPPWLGPTDDYHAAVEPGLRWLYTHVPSYSEWNRFLIFWKMGDGVLAGVTVDPDWEPKDKSVGLFNDILRQLLTGYLETEFADRPDLRDKVVPTLSARREAAPARQRRVGRRR